MIRILRCNVYCEGKGCRKVLKFRNVVWTQEDLAVAIINQGWAVLKPQEEGHVPDMHICSKKCLESLEFSVTSTKTPAEAQEVLKPSPARTGAGIARVLDEQKTKFRVLPERGILTGPSMGNMTQVPIIWEPEVSVAAVHIENMESEAPEALCGMTFERVDKRSFFGVLGEVDCHECRKLFGAPDHMEATDVS